MLLVFRWKCVGGGDNVMGRTHRRNFFSTKSMIKASPSLLVGPQALFSRCIFQRLKLLFVSFKCDNWLSYFNIIRQYKCAGVCSYSIGMNVWRKDTVILLADSLVPDLWITAHSSDCLQIFNEKMWKQIAMQSHCQAGLPEMWLKSCVIVLNQSGWAELSMQTLRS